MIVYKYLPPARIDVLEKSRIRFTQPAVLNDPFEVMPNLTMFADHVVQVLHDKVKERFGEALAKATLKSRTEQTLVRLQQFSYGMSDHFAFLSLSKQRNNLLMWSHYCDSHKGFIIGFDSQNPFLDPTKSKTAEGLREVHYTNERYVFPSVGITSMTRDQVGVANVGCLFTKSKEWSYEKELRIVAAPTQADAVIPLKDDFPICLFNFPVEAVKLVILGYQMSEDNIVSIAKVLRERYPKARLYNAMLDPQRFKLKIVRQDAREIINAVTPDNAWTDPDKD